jgi:hypothetical protein
VTGPRRLTPTREISVSIFTHVVPRSPRGRSALVVAAAVTMAASTLSVATNAHAESGRRICYYSFKAWPKNQNEDNPRLRDPLAQVSFGVDYKKDGACPRLDPAKLEATGYVDVADVTPQDRVPKMTCEEWGDSHQTFLTDLGADPCPEMWDNYLYAFVWQDPTTPNAIRPYSVRFHHTSYYSY